MVERFDVTYCMEIKEGGGFFFLPIMLMREKDLLLFIYFFFVGEGEATGVSGEGVCAGGGAYSSQSGGESVASSSFIRPSETAT